VRACGGRWRRLVIGSCTRALPAPCRRSAGARLACDVRTKSRFRQSCNQVRSVHQYTASNDRIAACTLLHFLLSLFYVFLCQKKLLN